MDRNYNRVSSGIFHDICIAHGWWHLMGVSDIGDADCQIGLMHPMHEVPCKFLLQADLISLLIKKPIFDSTRVVL